MKLGKDTGSVTNWVMSSNKGVPIVGEGMTRFMWSDRYAYEVMEVSEDRKEVIVQEYNFTYNPYSEDEGELTTLRNGRITLRFRYGSWWAMGEHGNSKWNVRFGMKSAYRDPYF